MVKQFGCRIKSRALAWVSMLLLMALASSAMAQIRRNPNLGYSKRPAPFILSPVPDTKYEAIYDAAQEQYLVYRKVGNLRVGAPQVMTVSQYRDFRRNEALRNYWQAKTNDPNATQGGGILPTFQVGGESFDRIFGSNKIEIIPQGSAELLFGITHAHTENYTIPEEMRSNTTFDFDTKLQVNVTGMVGDKLRMDVKYNTEAMFDFEQNVKVEYTGYEDEIIQKIEAGNVSMALPGTLITGSQSLFGFRTDLRFGKLDVSTIFSQRKGQSQSIEVKGGAQTKEFEVQADQYEANRHFFLSKYFYDTYDNSLSTLPLISSGIEIQRIEVWVTNKQGKFENSRDIVSFVDLGENAKNVFNDQVAVPTPGAIYPANGTNSLYKEMTTTYKGIRQLSNVSSLLAPLAAKGFRNGLDYEKVETARLLRSSEYTLNKRLGFISLNITLNADEVLAVAYEYTVNGRTYKVGEFANEGIDSPNALIVKMLKGTDLSPSQPTWNLMMKNVYSIGAFQISPQDFTLDVLYQDDEVGTAINYLNAGQLKDQLLLSILNLDNLNQQGNTGPDGVFDFVEGVTVLSATGRIIFPEVEPFGRFLADKIGDRTVAEAIAYTELYDSTLVRAQEMAEKNRFLLRGEYRSSSSNEISLNAPNVPKGSVVVTAGGKRLVENVDYVVDYLLGTVRIINIGLLESGTPINISLESNLGIDFQVKTLMGTHLNYQFSENFNVGATVLNMMERPLTKKVNFGNEAMSNTIWGFNTSFQTQVPWLTRAIDWLPLIETKAPSTFTFEGEMAQLVPGHSRFLDNRGSVYLDDFEANKSSIDLRMWSAWSMASTPQGQPAEFPEGDLINDLAYGYNRAKIAWYNIDPLFLRNSSLTPAHIRNDPDQQSSHFVREVEEKEIFPNRDIKQGMPSTIPVLNVAFYPNERGPNNYDADAIDRDGSLKNPEMRWGGMMRALPLTDFESSNIEYIEFWLMDPFVEDPNLPGADMLINIGNVSEDILRDSRKAFENGLPADGDPNLTQPSVWGKQPVTQSSVLAFDNDPAARKVQDVGLDGLNDEEERAVYASFVQKVAANHGAASPAAQQVEADPSADNFKYFRSSDWDNLGTSILDRYKLFNNTQGNSPTTEQSPEPYPTSSTTIPDVEDLNHDNTLSESESYYQYRISMRKQDLVVGKNYVTDKVVARPKLANGKDSPVTWYQFKIPVKEYDQKVGPIQDFKSIRFMRLLLKNCPKPIVLRFATLGLVRGEWRRYNRSLLEAQLAIGAPLGVATSFEVSAVNIEENSARTPVNYVLPPNVTREIDASQSVENELNEQAMELKVLNLHDGDARAAYRSVSYDLRQYKRLAMDVHAEAVPGDPLRNGELSLFIRLGSDYSENYYEYEVPLTLTPPGLYNNNSEADRRIVWPTANAIDIDLKLFREVKLARNDAVRAGSTASPRTPYKEERDGRYVTVVGYPNLGNVRVMMVGIRNMIEGEGNADGYPKSGVVWVNELRLSRLEGKGGWAALASMSARLADLGNLSLTGRLETPGFGSLESKVNNRVKEMRYQYDANATFEIGRFFPSKWQVSIPLFMGYSEAFADPEYNPLDPDVPFYEALEHLEETRAKDSLRRIAQDYTRRRSINLSNVRVNQASKTPMPWDLANFSLSYAYSEQNSRDVKTEYRNQISHRGGLYYTYNARPKTVEPFRRISWMQSPYLALIRDFNFQYMPRMLSFRTEINRNYMEQKSRNINAPLLQIKPTYAKNFEWTRQYGLSWDIMRTLRFEFSANNFSVIDEPEGIVDRSVAPALYRQWSDSVWSSIRHFGRTRQYDHKFSLAYALPFNRIPFLAWLSANFTYTGEFRWDAAPILRKDLNLNIGNTIQNAGTTNIAAQASLVSLYGKVSYLNEINQKFDRLANGEPLSTKQEYKIVNYSKDRINLRANTTRTVTHSLRTEDVTVRLVDKEGNEIPVQTEIRDENRVRLTADKDIRGARVEIEGKRPKSQFSAKLIGEAFLRLLMSVRNVSANFTQNNGTYLPGYLPGTTLLGFSRLGPNAGPGFPFLVGMQDETFPWRAIDMDWLSRDPSVQDAFKLTHTSAYSYRITIEPFPFARLEITGMRSYSRNESEYYRVGADDKFQSMSRQVTGNMSISTIMIATSFQRSTGANNYASQAFEQFSAHRLTVARRWAAQRAEAGAYNANLVGQDGVFPDGYGPQSQDVLIPAFLAAYTGRSAEHIPLDPFPIIPLPNWQFTYDGLSRMAFIRDHLKQLSIRHGYRANYVIGNFISNEAYAEEQDGFSYIRNLQNDFVPQNQIDNLTLSEQFAPLVGVDLGLSNSLTAKAEVRKSRTLAMSFQNNQLTDQESWEYIVGAGYRIDNIPLIVKTNLGGRKVLKSEIRIQADFGLRNTSTILRKLLEGTNTPTAGQWSYSIKLSADYMISEQITVRAFFDRMSNKPLVSLSFPTSNTSFGISVRFTLEQ